MTVLKPSGTDSIPTDPSDFDGHTAFASLSFTQKLTWISESVVSVHIIAGENETAGCHALFSRPHAQVLVMDGQFPNDDVAKRP